MDKLLPCPFCGNTTALETLDQNEAYCIGEENENYSKNPYYQVVCCVNENTSIPVAGWEPGCGGSSGFRPTKLEAVDLWNHRPKPENEPCDIKEYVEDCAECGFCRLLKETSND